MRVFDVLRVAPAGPWRYALAAAVALLIWLIPLGAPIAQSGDVTLNSVIDRLEQGELAAARVTLQALRRQRFPGRSFSGATCRNEPGFALMVAAERKLASGDGAVAGNYLQQLRCLQLVQEASPAEKRSIRLLRGFRDLVPERVNECPFALGAPALERSTQALDDGRFRDAWDEMLVAACLSGQGDAEFARVHRRLDAAVRRHAARRETAAIVVPAPEPEPVPEPVTVPVRPDISLPAPVEETAGGEPDGAVGPDESGSSSGAGNGAASLSELISSQTSPGEIAFNPPQSMQLDRAETIEVRIQPGQVVTEGMLGGGDTQVESIGVTPSMSVRLCCGPPEGDSPFDILSLSDERQLVSPGTFTQWIFEVTPRKEGPQVLTLSVSAQYRLPNGEVVPKNFPVLTRNIQVNVDAWGALPLWSGLAALLAVLPLLWWWSRRRKGAARIFVSYRRDDSSGWVQGLHDRLAEHFGAQVVFMDLSDIAPGSDFVTTLNRALKETRVVLVVIGRRWLDAIDVTGQRRLDDPADWVRLEVQKAIGSDKRVIPVLVDGAEMPDPADLPEEIRALSRYQAVKIYADQFSSGVQMLIQAIDLAPEGS